MTTPRKKGRGVSLNVDRRDLITALNRYFKADFFSLVWQRSDARWSGLLLVLCWVLMAWAESSTLAQGFASARQTLVAWFPKRRRPGKTYNGFIAASIRHSPVLLALVQEHLWDLVRHVAERGNCWVIWGWVPIGGDGTRAAAPRTKANRKGLGGLGRDRLNPQGWLTMLIHLGTGLPWCWTVGRGDSSERLHLKQMLGCLPAKSLFIADAGFVGYDLWRMMMQLGQPFLIRVGANVNLIRNLAEELGAKACFNAQVVWLWPKDKRSKQPPLRLRLVVLRDGKVPVYLVTNVMEVSRLSEQDALVFYAMRWGLELWFRSMKQTMGKRKLRSCAPEQALLELSWAAVGLSVLGLMHVEGLIDAGQAPGLATVAGALAVVRQAAQRPARQRRPGRQHRPGCQRQSPGRLLPLLGRTHKDGYLRKGPKQTGRYPRKKQYRCAGPPDVRDATAQEQQQYREFIRTAA